MVKVTEPVRASMTPRRAILAVALLASCASAWSADFSDDFASGAKGWAAGPAWSTCQPTPGAFRYRGDAPDEAFAWRTDWPLASSWSCAAGLEVVALRGGGGETGSGGLALSSQSGNPSPRVLLTISRHRSRMTLIELEYLDGNWHKVLTSGWLPGADALYRIELKRELGDDFLHVSVGGDQGLNYAADTPPIPLAVLDNVACLGLRTCRARAEFARIELTSPSAPAGYCRSSAEAAVRDLLGHFWVGDPASGRIAPTWNGYPGTSLPDARGGMWERGTLLTALDNLHRVTGSPDLKQRITSDWQQVKARYTSDELEAAGPPIHSACDDSGWDALMYLRAYHVTADPVALKHAKALIDSACKRWLDDQLGGGMWYSDERKAKSLYQIGIVLAALEVYDLTKERPFLDRALACYNWMEQRLLRPDGLYWADFGATGPIGADRPDDIHEAGSVTFLGGDMGMGVAQARLFRITGDEAYRKKALRTADAIRTRLTDGKGVLLDDRDAWANGTFAGEWAREVLSLPGIAPQNLDLMRATARAIYIRARTANGLYGGSWNGPADGPGSRWSSGGSRPQQIMTSANAVNMIVAAAALER